jgi:hypothetical protein
MAPLSHYAPLIEDDDIVGMEDRADPLRYNNYGRFT